jgi:hypothetical protein
MSANSANRNHQVVSGDVGEAGNGTDVLTGPMHLVISAPERLGEVLKVLENGTQGAQ